MELLLFRIDDRLIHGQVSIGWAGPMKPDVLLVVDDEAAADAFEGDLICSACPESTHAEVLRVDDAPAALAGPLFARRRVFLLVRSTRTARRLVAAGVPVPVINIGGLHHHPGSRSILPSVFLDDSEVADLKWLAERGTRLSAQDLPGNKAFDLTPLLDRGGS